MRLTQQLCAVAQAMGCHFTLRNEAIAPQQAFADIGLLPALMRRADQLCSFCLGYGLGVTFERSEVAMLGVKLQLDEQISDTLRLLCATDVPTTGQRPRLSCTGKWPRQRCSRH